MAETRLIERCDAPPVCDTPRLVDGAIVPCGEPSARCYHPEWCSWINLLLCRGNGLYYHRSCVRARSKYKHMGMYCECNTTRHPTSGQADGSRWCMCVQVQRRVDGLAPPADDAP